MASERSSNQAPNYEQKNLQPPNAPKLGSQASPPEPPAPSQIPEPSAQSQTPEPTSSE